MILRGLRAAALALILGGLASAQAPAQVPVQPPVTTPAQTQGQPPSGLSVEFTSEELARIASFGPWPPAPVRDASNRVDGLPKAIALGQRLFSDPRLSASGQLACITCHDPKQAFQDGQRFTRHGRNTPSLLDAGQRRWFGWDGANDSLWAASLQPLTAAGELAASPASVLTLLRADRALLVQYRAVFGPPQADDTLLVNVAKALAAYQATQVSPRTVFDDFRDALVRGDQAGAAARFAPDAQRGLQMFVGPGRCFFCHAGPAFTNGEFADVGRPFFSAAGVDPGRWGGLQQLLASRYNRLGPYADAGASSARASHASTSHASTSHASTSHASTSHASTSHAPTSNTTASRAPASHASATHTSAGDGSASQAPAINDSVSDARASATAHVVQEPRHYGEFKVPGLRGLAATAPYFHDGSAATLDDVVRHYSELDESRLHADGARVLQALRLTPEQSADLVAFLQTLSAPAVLAAPLSRGDHRPRRVDQQPAPSSALATLHPAGSSKR